MNVIFMGTPDFAVDSLEALSAAGHHMACVITQPDRPKGRGKKMMPPPVKERALAMGLAVYQPTTVKDEAFLSLLRSYQPDVIVVAAYGRLLPQAVLDLPPYGCVNVHGSLLPRYRGAAPVQRTILNGDTLAGVTIMQMEAGMDTGAMLNKVSLDVAPNDTAGTLFDKLAKLGAKALVQTLSDLQNGTVIAQVQDEALATYAPMLTREEEVINWQNPANKLHNQVRGLSPSPGAYTYWQGERLKIWRTAVDDDENYAKGLPGEVVEVATDSFVVRTKDSGLRIYEVQPAGKKIMSAQAFLNGAGLTVGSKLGYGHE